MAELQDKVSFNVITEPWISVVRGDGAIAEVGLLEAMLEGHRLREIRDPMPPVECGLLRLLIAFAIDIHEPQDARDWADIWRKGCFDQEKVLTYFEEHKSRFNLFDELHPFLQEARADGEDKPLAGLLASQPGGTNAAHFHHGDETDFAIAPAVAARLLAAIAPFMTAGGAGLSPSINGAPPWYVLLLGNNLFETIWLNCPVIADILPQSGIGHPAWRDDEPVVKEDRTEASLLEALTWRPRRVRLLPYLAGENGHICAASGLSSAVLIKRMKFTAGWSTRFEWRDPHVPYRVSKDGAMVLRPREGRELWRDVGSLALLRKDEDTGRDFRSERPLIVTQFTTFIESRRLPNDTPFRLAVYGMRTDMKMKIFEWHHEQMALPAPLLWKRQFHSVTESEMKRAEDVAYALKQAIRQNYPRDGAGNDRAFDSLTARAQSEFWRRLRPHYIDDPNSLLHQLAPLRPDEDTEKQHAFTEVWQGALKKVAMQTLDDAIGELDADGEALKRQMEARRYFEGRLWALLNPVAAAEAKKKKKGAKNE